MRNILTVAAALALVSSSVAGPIAFPGAMGFGANATGGRGGDVVHVTNLNDDGAGSFRDAITEPNRTVVFDVGGVINSTKQFVVADNITIAGQTAPGGIGVFGTGISMSGRKNIILRYMTFRSGIASGRGSKSLNIYNGQNIIVDHCSIGWGRWDNVGITAKEKEPTFDVTLQNCLIHEAIKDQQFGMIVDNVRQVSLLRNLWINNRARNPKGKGDIQYINNVIYNWGNQGYGGGHSGAPWKQDLVGNYFIAGPDSKGGFFTFANANDLVHSSGNFVDADKDGTLNGRAWTEADLTKPDAKTGDFATPTTNPSNRPAVAVDVLSAADAVKTVIATVGNSLHRDSVDLRQIEQLQSYGRLGKNPENEADVRGMPTPTTRPTAPTDSDGDGMPDEYESKNGLNPNDPADGKTLTENGYTRLEVYLNLLVVDRSRPAS